MLSLKLIIFLFQITPTVNSYEIDTLNNSLFYTGNNVEIADKILQDQSLLAELFPNLKETCIKFALKDFLPICLNDGIETVSMDIRVETAVRLSICQFEASGLENIPQSCSHYKAIDELMECMIELENFHDWWITYNGYFQKLSEICIQNSLPYQKDQILKMFLNLTNWADHINKRWSNEIDDLILQMHNVTESGLDKAEAKFQESIEKWESYSNTKLENLINQFDKHEKDLDDFFKENTDKLYHELTLKDEVILENVNTFQNEIMRINNQLEVMSIPKNLDNIQHNWDQTIVNMMSNSQDVLNEQLNYFFYDMNNQFYQQIIEVESVNNKSLTSFIENFDRLRENFTLDWTQVLEYNMDIFETTMNDKLNVMTKKIDKTIDQIDFLQFKLDRLIKIIKIGYNTVLLFPRCLIQAMSFLFKHNLIFKGEKLFSGIIIFISYYMKHCYKYKYSGTSQFIVKNMGINKKLINWSLILISIYLGRVFINTLI